MGRYGGVSKQAAKIRQRIARTRRVPLSKVREDTVLKGLTMRPIPIPKNANPGSAVRVLSPVRYFPNDGLPRAVGVEKALTLLKRQTFTKRSRPTKQEILRGKKQSFGKGTFRAKHQGN
ncbi:MAG: hypothetical protein WC462_01160 [archaeon]